MRGKRDCPTCHNSGYRITPAHAGKTLNATCFTSMTWDHPRACGENVLVRFSHCNETGSPPRMRGKLYSTEDKITVTRITPAHAGKTHRFLTAATARRDHPRACGENAGTEAGYSAMIGSPPRMRGKQAGSYYTIIEDGITPAHAGKTALHNAYCDAAKDHPRACGENRCLTYTDCPQGGSPPRMRGKPTMTY